MAPPVGATGASAPGSWAVVLTLAATAGGLAVAAAHLPTGPWAWWLVLVVGWVVATAVAVVERHPNLGWIALQAWLGLAVVAPATIAVIEGRTLLGAFDLTAGTEGALVLWAAAQWTVLVTVLVRRALWPRAGRCAVATSAPGAAAPAAAAPAAVARSQERPSRAALDRVAIGLVVAGALSLVAWVVVGGGSLSALNVLTGTATYGDVNRSLEAGGVAYLRSLVGLAGLALVVVALRVAIHGAVAPLAPVVVTAVAGPVLLAGGGRAWLVLPALSAGLVWWRLTPHRAARLTRSWVVAGAAAVFVVAVVVGGLRGLDGGKRLDVGESVRREVRTGVFPLTAVLVDEVPRTIPHLAGRSYRELLTLPVPRRWWPDKPGSSATALQRDLLGRNIGASYAQPGELYANWGWLAVIAGVALFTWLLDAGWTRFVTSTDLGTIVVLAVLLPIGLAVFSRGYLAGQLGAQLGTILGAWWVAHWLRRPANRPEPPRSRRDHRLDHRIDRRERPLIPRDHRIDRRDHPLNRRDHPLNRREQTVD